MTEVNKIADGKVQITTSVEGEQWAKAQEKAFNRLAKNVEIKGFRKGQAPKHMVKARLSEASIYAQAAEDIVDDTFKAALENSGIELIDRASLDIKEIDAGHVTFVFDCPVKPDVTLGDYKGLGYAPEEVVVTDEEVEEEIQGMIERRADLEIKEEGSVEMGDTVVIDFDGYKDGVAFEGGHGENYDLVIGSGSFIPGFEEALIGMQSEETKDIDLTFPEDYHVEELKGQPVVFKVTVHEIKVKVLPELDEELIKDMPFEGVSTPEELREFIKNGLYEDRKQRSEDKATNDLLDKVVGGATVNIPDVMIEDEIEDLRQEMDQNMRMQGFSLEQYQKVWGVSDEALHDNLKIDAEGRVKLRLVLEKVAEVEGVEISEEDIDNEVKEVAKRYGIEPENVENLISRRAVKNDLRIARALEILKA